MFQGIFSAAHLTGFKNCCNGDLSIKTLHCVLKSLKGTFDFK